MKTYYLTLSQVFPKDHTKAGAPTFFKNKVLAATLLKNKIDFRPKIHTIRANYEFWKKRFEKIEAGEACLSIREWVGKPYAKGSTQREIVRLTREDGIGIQKLCFETGLFYCPRIVFPSGVNYIPLLSDLARKDGLTVDDWIEWFVNYNLSKPLAIIHFTKFRYQE